MSQEYLSSGRDFEEALASYAESLAGHNNLGVISGASLSNKSGTKKNILVSLVGIIVGAFTGFGFYRTSSADTGSAVLTHDGIHFFPTKSKRVKEDGVRVKKQLITGHSYVGYAHTKKAVVSKAFFSKQISLIGKVQDENGRNVRYRLSIPISKDVEAVDTLKSKLEEQGIRTRKSRTGKAVAALFALLIATVIFFLFLPRWTNSYRPIDYDDFRFEINFPMHSASGRYQDRTTSFVARIATDVFTINLGDGDMDFVGATVAGLDRIFLLELNEDIAVPEIGDIADITAVGMGVISTRPRPELSAADRFFERIEIAFGDPRISGVVNEISTSGILSGTNYLHMLATEIEAVIPIVLGESDTYVSAGGNFQITIADAFFTTTGVGQRQTDIIVIFFDYEALVTHRASRPFNRIAVYQGDTLLESSGSGIRESVADGRGFLTTQEVEAGEVFRGMSAVVADNLTEPITLVIYGGNFDVLFMYEMAVR